MNAVITMICEPNQAPKFARFSSADFTPKLSEKQLIEGQGLLSSVEKEDYLRFTNANSNILAHYRDATHIPRNSNDLDVVKKYSNPPVDLKASPH